MAKIGTQVGNVFQKVLFAIMRNLTEMSLSPNLTVFSALKHSERRAFQCRETFDAEHSTSYGYGRFGAPGDECKVKIDEVGRFLIITSNGMPDHDHTTRNIRPQNIELSIPKHPTLLSVSFIRFFCL